MSTPSGSNAKLAIVAAVLVGLFAIVALNRYVREKTTLPEPPKVCVLAATAEIPAGADIADEWLTALSLPAEGLSNLHVVLPNRDDPAFAAAFAEAKTKFVGRPAKRLVAANTPLFWIDVENAPQTTLNDLIGEGMRAVTLPVDTVSSVCGFIRPGSRVDIVLTATEGRLGLIAQGGEGEPDHVVSMVIMQNVPVIATDRAYRLGEEADVAALRRIQEARALDLFVFRQTGVDPATRKVLGHHEAVGRPSFLGEFALRGIPFDAAAFDEVPDAR